YRWKQPWQTQRAWAQAQTLAPPIHCFFVTYGTAEFYRTPYKCGPASANFRHIGFDTMITLVEAALQYSLPSAKQFGDWLAAMKVEAEKRKNAFDLLAIFASFRRKYLNIGNAVGFPAHRLHFSAPELAFPVFHGLATLWNQDQKYCGKHGQVS